MSTATSAPATSAPAPAPVSAPTSAQAEVKGDAPVVAEAKTATKKPRRVVTSETVVAGFNDLKTLIEKHIEELRQTAAQATGTKSGSTGIKFLRTVNSRVKQLLKDSVKVMDASKKRPRRATNAEGGFLKPQHVTPQMAGFANWALDAMKSRVDVTNAICGYVREKNLQDPTCKKHILPDEKLKGLLEYDPSVAGNAPLTYFYLQKLIGKLLIKSPPKGAEVKA